MGWSVVVASANFRFFNLGSIFSLLVVGFEWAARLVSRVLFSLRYGLAAVKADKSYSSSSVSVYQSTRRVFVPRPIARLFSLGMRFGFRVSGAGEDSGEDLATMVSHSEALRVGAEGLRIGRHGAQPIYTARSCQKHVSFLPAQESVGRTSSAARL